MTGLKAKLYIFILLNYNKLSRLVLGMYSFWGYFLRIRARGNKYVISVAIFKIASVVIF